MAGTQPRQHVSGRGYQFFAAGQDATGGLLAAWAAGCMDHYPGGAGHRSAFQPQLQSMGLSEAADEFPGTDLPAVQPFVDTGQLGRGSAV